MSNKYTTAVSFERDSTTLVVGPTSSGKTTLLREILRDGSFSDGTPQRLYIVVPPVTAPDWAEWDSPFPITKIISQPSDVLQFLEHAKEVEENSIVIFDDFMTMLENTTHRRLIDEWVYIVTHQRHVWTFFVVHNMFHRNLMTIRRNAHNYILFDTMSADQAASAAFATRLFGPSGPLFLSLWRWAVRQPNGWIRVDNKLRGNPAWKQVVSTRGVTLNTVYFAARSDDDGAHLHVDAMAPPGFETSKAAESYTLIAGNGTRGRDASTDTDPRSLPNDRDRDMLESDRHQQISGEYER